MGRLDHRTAVVTGGSSGIGFATARQFTDEGAYVYLTGRRSSVLRAVAMMFALLEDVTEEHFDQILAANVRGLGGESRRDEPPRPTTTPEGPHMITDATPLRPTPHLNAADEPELVRAPRTTFVSIGGRGRPGTEAFYRKKDLVRAVARALPPTRQVTDAADVIELLYWYPEDAEPVEIADFYWVNPIDALEYRVLAAIAADTTTEELDTAARAAGATDENPELFTLPARPVVQIMHHGPFAGELDTLARLGAFAASQRVRRVGAHHEIHLDPFTAHTPQDRLRTILRDPVG